MTRSDRLAKLIVHLRGRKTHRAEDLALAMGVTARSIYRDIETLVSAGVPIEGTRGLGYRITAEVTLPPLNLSLDELEALEIGLAAAADAGDPALAGAATALLARIDQNLPTSGEDPPAGWGTGTPRFGDASARAHLPLLRAVIEARQFIDLGGRRLRPLGTDYWGRLWTLTVWDEDRGGFEVLRIDQMEGLRALPAFFVDEDGKRLSDYAAR